MNRIVKCLSIVALSGTLFAQTNPTTTPKQQFDELDKQYQLEATKVELNYNKLRDLKEFQDYLQGLKNLDEISKKAQALSQPPAPSPTETKPKK